MGAELRGEARNAWTRALIEYADVIPHYPGAEVIRPARIPPPAFLTGEDPEVWAQDLLGAYLTTASHFFNARLPLGKLPRRSVFENLSTRDRNTLDRAAVVLLEQQTQPVSWCAFSMKSWMNHGPMHLRRHRPAMNWVYSATRLGKADLWFQWAGSTTDGVRLVFPPAQKRLIRLYDKMRRQILAASSKSGLTAKKVSSIVAGTLPSALYRQLVAQAQTEAEMTQMEIKDDIRKGRYVW